MGSSFDVVVVGSGAAGFAAAEAARAEGATVCLAERDVLGGECSNWACVPSKALLRAARAYREARSLAPFGVSAGATFDWAKVMAWREAAVARVTGGTGGERYARAAARAGIEIVRGEAAFLDAQTVSVDGTRLRFKAAVVATGSSDIIPNIPGIRQIPFHTSREALRFDRQPKSMAIVGGGPVGCELATIFASFGTRVVLLERAPVLLGREDAELSAFARESLEALGVEVAVGAEVLEAINARGGVYGLRARAAGETAMHAVEAVVVATGKRANTDGLGAEALGLALDAHGNVKTDDAQRASPRHVFAAGDADGGPLFTHAAHREGTVAGKNAARVALGRRGGLARADLGVVPRVTFTDPEIAAAGMTEEEARQAFGAALVGRANVATLGRAVADRTERGVVKLVAHPETRAVVGCHAASPHAGELVHEAALAIRLGATVDQLAALVHAYPTYSEALVVAARGVE